MALQEAGLRLVADGASEYVRHLNLAEGSSKGFFNALDDGSKSVNSFGEIATGALRRVGEVAVNAFGQAVQAVGGFVKTSVDVAGNFESALQGFSAISGEALAQVGLSLDDVSDKALELGKSTAYSAQQALDAMTELSKGGVDLQSIMTDATDATLALAAASGMDLAPAAEIVAKQLGVWGDTGLKAAQVADLLASAANASTTDVEGLALGLANAGGVAKLVGASFEDTVTTLALLAPGFSSSADAGTSLKTALSRLSPASKEAKQAMQALGIITEDGTNKFYDASGSLRSMSEVAQILQDSLRGLSDEEKTMALNTIFGSDAIRAAALLAEAGAEGFDAMAESMGRAGGAAAQAAERNKGLNFAMESLRGSIETVQIVIGMALIPVLTELLNNYIIPSVNAFLEFAQAIVEADDPLLALTQAIDGVLPGFGEFARMIGSFALGTLIPNLQGIADTISGAVGPAFSNFASTVMPNLTASFKTLQERSAEVQAWINENWPGISETLTNGLTGFRSWIDEQWSKVKPAIIETLDGVKSWASEQWTALEPILKGTLENVVNWVQDRWPTVETTINQAIDNIVNHASTTMPQLGEIFTVSGLADFATAIKGVFDIIFGGGNAGGAMETVKLLERMFGKETTSQILQFGAAISSRVMPVIEKFSTIIARSQPYINQISKELSELGQAVIPALATILTVAVAALLALANAILYGISVALPFLIAGLAGVIAFVSNFVTGFLDLVVGLGTALYDLFTGNFAAAWQTLTSTLGQTFLDIVELLGNAVQAILGIIGGVVAAILAFFYGLYISLVGGSIIPDMINAIIQWFALLPSQILAFIVQMVTSLINYVAVNLGVWAATLFQWGTQAWQWLQVAVPQLLTQLAIWGTSLLSYLAINLPIWIANLLQWGNAAWQWVVNAIPVLVTHLTTFFTTLSTWALTTVLPAIIEFALKWATAAYEWVVNEAIPGVVKGLAEFLKTMLARLADIAKEMLKAAKTVGENIIDGMVDAIKDGLSSVVGAIMDVVNRAIQAAKDALGISSPSRVFADMGRDTVGGFNEGAESANVTTSIGNLFNGIISLATSILPQWISTLMRWGEAAWNWVVQAIPLTMAHLNAWATQILFFTTGKLPEWMAILLLWGNEAWEWLRDAIPQLQIQLLAYWTALLTWSQGSMLPMLQEQGQIWGETLYMWIPQTLIPGIQPHWTAFLVNSLVRLTQIQIQFGKKGQDLGNAIIDGMVDAIKDGQSSVVSAIISTVVAAIRAAKEALGIASPSAVFMTIGADTMQGLSLGIREETATAVGVIVGAIDRMIKAVPATLGAGTIAPPMSGGQIAQNSIINNSMTRTLNYSPTYNTAPPQIVDIAIASAMMGA